VIDLTISIGTLGNFEVLARCLTSLFQEDAPDLSYEVSVVYNGPGNDGTVEKIRGRYPQVRLIERLNPLGYCVTHNLVLARNASRYTLLLDDDTILSKGVLSAMVSFMDRNPDVGIAGCKTLNADGSFQPSYAVEPSLRTELMNMFWPDRFWPGRLYRDVSGPRDVDWLNASFLLVRKEVVDRVGTLDEHYYTYFCESDWCHRIRRSGFRVVYYPGVTITHVGGEHGFNAKMKTMNVVGLVRYHANRFYFFRKHYRPVSCFLLRPIVALGAALRVGRYIILYLAEPRLRRLSRTRLTVYWEVIKLSFSRKPYELPACLHNLPTRNVER
jgi:hypothetical protein